MTWSPYSFSNLSQVGEVLFGYFPFHGGTTDRWTFDDKEDWRPTESVFCDVYALGSVVSTEECPLAALPPDSDHAIAPTTPPDAQYAHVTYTITGAYNGAYDEFCYAEHEHVIGLLSGGCRPMDPVYPFLDLRNDKDYQNLIDIDGVATRTAFGTTFEDGFNHLEIGGDWMIVNPSPITYRAMDPANAANQALFAVADLPEEFWLHFRPPDLTPVFLGRTFGQLSIAVRYFKVINDTDEPIGTITAGQPISGVVQRKTHT